MCEQHNAPFAASMFVINGLAVIHEATTDLQAEGAVVPGA